MNSPELSLFLPVLDEEDNLRPMHAKIGAALDALGMTTGLSHMEWFRRTDGSVAVSEVAPDPEGLSC